MPVTDPASERVLVLAPLGRDAAVIAGVVDRAGAPAHVVADFAALTDAIAAGAGAAVVVEEALVPAPRERLAEWLGRQEPWSDFPFVVLLARRGGGASPALAKALAALGNVVLLERPLSTATLTSAVQSALRARRRQYQAREVLAQRAAVSDELVTLNATLEARVAERTAALAQANDRLTAEIIERERTQQAMVQYQKMESLGQLTGGIAHDFNNLLNVMQGSLELILMASKDEAVRARARVAQAACQRGAKLTAQLLAFARNQTLDLRPLRVDAMFDAVLELARPLLGAAVTLRASVDPDVECVQADATQLEMALLNLAINARDAMPGGGAVTLSATRAPAPPGLSAAGDYVCLAVADNGPGMSADVAGKAFEPFFTTKGVGKGTGLGLSQVYGMARQSGGMARLCSRVGQGTTVELWLPVAGSAAANVPQDDAGAATLDGVKVLVVEDDDIVRASLVDALTTLGCKVTQAADGHAALAAADAAPDLLLTDYRMPGMTGAELAARMRERWPHLPVIVATGYADMAAIDGAVGAAAVLRKPFQIADLASAAAGALAGAADTRGVRTG